MSLSDPTLCLYQAKRKQRLIQVNKSKHRLQHSLEKEIHNTKETCWFGQI